MEITEIGPQEMVIDLGDRRELFVDDFRKGE
jgi:hypothetical protein